MSNEAFSFDFQRDVAAKCFWTKSYKKAHPKPKNNMPKTVQDYYRAVNRAADKAKDIPSPEFEKDKKLVDLPNPEIYIRKYNNPPGSVDLNLNKLRKNRYVNSIGVVSPEFDKMAYTTVFYYPSARNAGTELYLMNLDTSKTVLNRIKEAHVNQGKKLLFRTGLDSLDLAVFKTLTIVDWSSDGKKLALKEKISYEPDGLWKTNLLVYDFEKNQMNNLNEVREAVKYYWRENENLFLKDYRWDIYPVGWDSLNPDRIIVFAYAATGEKPKYLGAWSVDYEGHRAMLMSLTSTAFEVSQNGSALKSEVQ